MRFAFLLILTLKLTLVSNENVLWHKVSPVQKTIGECVTFYAKSVYTITKAEYLWKKDTLKYEPKSSDVVIRGDKLEIKYAQPSDSAYYTVSVETSYGTETTQFWLTVEACKSHEREDRDEHEECTSSCKEVCETDWILHRGKCWRYYDTSKTWDSALTECQKDGALLATINDEEENKFVGQLLRSGLGAWIGLNDRHTENEFVWNHDKESHLTYTAWDSYDKSSLQPDNYNNKCNLENCVELTLTGKWNDASCVLYFFFICQKPRSETDEKTSQWKCLNSVCYHMPLSEMATWSEAVEKCSSPPYSGTLAQISSSEQNDFVQKLKGTGKSAWIGISDNQEAGIYLYSDGSKVTFFNWGVGEPNDMIYRDSAVTCPGEDCVLVKRWLTGVTWRDVSCLLELPYICKIERVSYLTLGAWVAIGLGCFAIVTVIIGVIVITKVKENKIRPAHKPKD